MAGFGLGMMLRPALRAAGIHELRQMWRAGRIMNVGAKHMLSVDHGALSQMERQMAYRAFKTGAGSFSSAGKMLMKANAQRFFGLNGNRLSATQRATRYVGSYMAARAVLRGGRRVRDDLFGAY